MYRIVINIWLLCFTGLAFAQDESYRGGSGDGHAFDRSETAFSFSPSFQPFQGGNGGGYKFLSQETPFGLALIFQPFRGASGAGYKTDSMILFDPRDYITMYYPFAGSMADGATNAPILGIFIPLPLQLLEFKGEQEKDKNILLWTTANEEQTASFVIQRSADALHYKDIGTLAAAGEHSGMLQYRYEDSKPLDKNNYYRLKMLDQDGKFTYSPVILLKRYGTGGTMSVFPNPATQRVQIMMDRAGADGPVTAQLVDMSGKVLQQKQVVNNSTIHFELDRCVPGIYLIRVQAEGELSVWKVIKQ